MFTNILMHALLYNCFSFVHVSHDRAFGYSSEDVQMIIESMASQGKEPTFCMGDDIPLAILSQRPHMLYDYFKQRFAQVSYKLIFLSLLNCRFVLTVVISHIIQFSNSFQ